VQRRQPSILFEIGASRKRAFEKATERRLFMKKFLLQASCVAALGAALASPASAIECRGNFQVEPNGSNIASPFCEDRNLAHVARESGMRVSAAAVRGNPGVKERVCRTVGEDNRVRDTCDQYLHPSNE
jgi:hypothetical protein